MFGGKKVCPNCGQPQEKNWDKCPFCANMGGGIAMGGGMGGMSMGGGPPPPAGGFGGFGGPPPPAPGGYGAPMGGPPPMMGGGQMGGGRTVALVAGAAGVQQLGWVVPLKGPHRGELITLKAVSVVGKDPTCDVVFNDPFMSGRHATIRAQASGFVLEDHSTNGTFVNDKKIRTHELVDSDFVKFGQTLVKFKAL
jgi:hypothetical protein